MTMLKEKLKDTSYVFVLTAIIIGFCLAVLNPPFQECDGLSHFRRAMDVSYGNFLGSFCNLTHENGVINVPENFSEMPYFIATPNAKEGGYLGYLLRNMTFSSEKITVPDSSSVTSCVYWPQGIGIWLGRTLKLNVFFVVLLGKLFNLIAYVALTFMAIKKMPVFKNLMLAIALMPITLYQAASLSPDSVLNGVTFLFIALCFNYAVGDSNEQLSWKNTIILGFLLLIMFLCKYVYICLGLLVFMIPSEKFGDKKNYWKSFVISILPILILGGYVFLRVAPDVTTSDTQIASDGMTQLQYLMGKPVMFIKVFCSTILMYFNEYLKQMDIFGNLNYELTLINIICPCVIACIGCLEGSSLPDNFSRKNRVLSLFAFLLTFYWIIMALYIADPIANPVGGSVSAGVQGRYFVGILILPFIALASKNIKITIKNWMYKICFVMILMDIYSIMMLYRYCY